MAHVPVSAKVLCSILKHPEIEPAVHIVSESLSSGLPLEESVMFSFQYANVYEIHSIKLSHIPVNRDIKSRPTRTETLPHNC